MSSNYKTPERYRRARQHAGDVINDVVDDGLRLSFVALSALPRAINERRFEKGKEPFRSIAKQLKDGLGIKRTILHPGPEKEIGWGDPEKGYEFYFRASEHGDCDSWRLKQTLPTGGQKEVHVSFSAWARTATDNEGFDFSYRELDQDGQQVKFVGYPRSYGYPNTYGRVRFVRQQMSEFVDLMPPVEEMISIQQNMPSSSDLPATQSS